MSLPKPQYVANLLVTQGDNRDFKRLDDIVYTVLRDLNPNFSEEEIWDYIDTFRKDIATELYIKVGDNKRDGIVVNYSLVQEDEGTYLIKYSESPEIRLLRSLRTNTPEYFEGFCARILDKIGGTSTVTGGSHDGGIDFMSSDLRLHSLPTISTKGANIFVIGQAKRYDGSQITEKHLREFIGCCVKRIDELKKSRPDAYGIFQPTMLAYWTTSDFHANAKKFAKEMGIWYLGGVALSQLAIQLNVE